MSSKFIKTTFVWGFLLWLFGYILGFIFFAFVPSNLIGWAIMPFGILATIFVLYKKIALTSLKEYFWLGAVWAVIAEVCDYLFLVKLLKPADGYYKPDVFIYYVLTFLIPVIIGYIKINKSKR